MAMIISVPDDGTNRLYHVVNLEGQTVLAYRSPVAAIASMEGDQRLFIYDEINYKWIGAAPAPEATVAIERLKCPINVLVNACRSAYDALDDLEEPTVGIKRSLEYGAKELVMTYNSIDKVKS